MKREIMTGKQAKEVLDSYRAAAYAELAKLDTIKTVEEAEEFVDDAMREIWRVVEYRERPEKGSLLDFDTSYSEKGTYTVTISYKNHRIATVIQYRGNQPDVVIVKPGDIAGIDSPVARAFVGLLADYVLSRWSQAFFADGTVFRRIKEEQLDNGERNGWTIHYHADKRPVVVSYDSVALNAKF